MEIAALIRVSPPGGEGEGDEKDSYVRKRTGLICLRQSERSVSVASTHQRQAGMSACIPAQLRSLAHLDQTDFNALAVPVSIFKLDFRLHRARPLPRHATN
jgi:hypothetical protein